MKYSMTIEYHDSNQFVIRSGDRAAGPLTIDEVIGFTALVIAKGGPSAWPGFFQLATDTDAALNDMKHLITAASAPQKD
jgi:hypothetical protein